MCATGTAEHMALRHVMQERATATAGSLYLPPLHLHIPRSTIRSANGANPPGARFGVEENDHRRSRSGKLQRPVRAERWGLEHSRLAEEANHAH